MFDGIPWWDVTGWVEWIVNAIVQLFVFGPVD